MELKRRYAVITEPARSLLIVPYGIETEVSDTVVCQFRTFNRTLWN